jgi:hypothetical protein
MAFTISKQGRRAGVAAAIASEKLLPESADKSQVAQVEAVKALIASEISALDPKFNGVRVNAQGDAHAGGRTLQVTIQPMELHL